MNGNNKDKEVKQTSNEQQEKQQPSLSDLSNRIALSHDILKGEHVTLLEDHKDIKQGLADLFKQIACDHAGLKGEHASIIERLDGLERHHAMLVGNQSDIKKTQAILLRLCEAKKPESPPEKADQPADEKPEQTDEKEQPDGSGL